VSTQIIDMLDGAAFAQLPLETTGDSVRPIRLRSGAEAEYKFDTSRQWRMVKRMFSSYLLGCFAAGEPFQAGPGWRLMGAGVRAMAGRP
jgi:hypothetical protein